VQNHHHESVSTSFKFFAGNIFYPTGAIWVNIIMRIQDLDEDLSTALAKGVGYLASKSAATAARTAPRAVELIARQQASLAQIERIAADPRNPQAVAQVVQRLRVLHSDLYDIAHMNKDNVRVVEQANRLRDDLAGMIRHIDANSRQPGANGVILDNVKQLVPVLNNKLRNLEQLIKKP
jgi:hypothetical protein